MCLPPTQLSASVTALSGSLLHMLGVGLTLEEAESLQAKVMEGQVLLEEVAREVSSLEDDEVSPLLLDPSFPHLKFPLHLFPPRGGLSSYYCLGGSRFGGLLDLSLSLFLATPVPPSLSSTSLVPSPPPHLPPSPSPSSHPPSLPILALHPSISSPSPPPSPPPHTSHLLAPLLASCRLPSLLPQVSERLKRNRCVQGKDLDELVKILKQRCASLEKLVANKIKITSSSLSFHKNMKNVSAL